MWYGAGSQASDLGGMKFFHRTPSTSGTCFLAGHFGTLDLYKSAFSDLSYQCCGLDFADCLTCNNNSVPGCLATIAMNSQWKASKGLLTFS
jgi:hypothetical protein